MVRDVCMEYMVRDVNIKNINFFVIVSSIISGSMNTLLK